MLTQVSIYAENKKGTLLKITDILAKENINIWGSVTNDGAEFGINRMVVSDPVRAHEALSKEGFLCRDVDVIGVELEDEVGNLNRLLLALSDSNINVNYMYLSFNRDSGKPVIVFQTDDIWEAEECISTRGFHVV